MKKQEGLSSLVSTCNCKMVYSISITVNLNLRKSFLYHKPLKLLTYKTFDFVFSKNTELKFSNFFVLDAA